MRKLTSVGIALAVLGLSSAAIADGAATVKILAPADGATLDAMAQNKIAYEVNAGADGDHVHLYVDKDEVALLRQLKGSRTLEGLTPGAHRLCIKVVNKNHTPVGAEACVKVKVE
jgi:hypothetical protein